jgi:hypothetical protein
MEVMFNKSIINMCNFLYKFKDIANMCLKGHVKNTKEEIFLKTYAIN